MFEKNKRVSVTNCMVLQGSQPWQGMNGKVTKIEVGKVGRRWIWVLLDDDSSREPLPMRESEISEADEDEAAQEDGFRSHTMGSRLP